MKTKELVVAIQTELKEQGIESSQKTVKAHMSAFEAVVVKAVKRGEDVKLKGFVDFVSKEVSARTAKNPKTGEDVAVPAHRKASAKLSQGLRKF